MLSHFGHNIPGLIKSKLRYWCSMFPGGNVQMKLFIRLLIIRWFLCWLATIGKLHPFLCCLSKKWLLSFRVLSCCMFTWSLHMTFPLSSSLIPLAYVRGWNWGAGAFLFFFPTLLCGWWWCSFALLQSVLSLELLISSFRLVRRIIHCKLFCHGPYYSP